MDQWQDKFPPLNLYNFPSKYRNNMKLDVYSKSNCPACEKATNLLDSMGIAYNVKKIDEDPVAKEFIISEGWRSVPQIYKDGCVFVKGGYLGLVEMSEESVKALLYGK